MPRVRGNRPAPSFPWAELKHVTGRIARYFKYHTIGRAQRLLGKLPIISWPFNRARVLARALARARNRRNRRARREAREAENNNNNNDNRETLPSPPRTPSPARHSDNGGTAQWSSPNSSPSAQLLFEQAQRPPTAAAPPPLPLPPRAPRRNMRLLAEVDEDNVVHGRRVRRQTARYQ